MSSLGKCITGLAMGLLAYALIPKKEKKNHSSLVPVGEFSAGLPENLGCNQDEMMIYYYRPASWTPRRPVWIAYSGAERKADSLRTALEDMAVKYNVLVACPDYSKRKFPGCLWYQEGNVITEDSVKGQVKPQNEWTFSLIDDITREVKKRTGSLGPVVLFGHSAGGQLLHRYVLLGHPKEADRIVIANSGWFTLPDRNVNYPYGIANLSISDEELARSFGKDIRFLMGSLDTKRNLGFRTTPEAEKQGKNRMERCRYFYHYCEKKAQELGVPFHWKLDIVPGAAHQTVKMSEGAIKGFSEDPDDPIFGK